MDALGRKRIGMLIFIGSAFGCSAAHLLAQTSHLDCCAGTMGPASEGIANVHAAKIVMMQILEF